MPADSTILKQAAGGADGPLIAAAGCGGRGRPEWGIIGVHAGEIEEESKAVLGAMAQIGQSLVAIGSSFLDVERPGFAVGLSQAGAAGEVIGIRPGSGVNG